MERQKFLFTQLHWEEACILLIYCVIWLLNMKVDEVFSYANKVTTKNTQFKYPDLITTIFKTNKKLIGKITSNFGCVYPHFHKISIYGTKEDF